MEPQDTEVKMDAEQGFFKHSHSHWHRDTGSLHATPVRGADQNLRYTITLPAMPLSVSSCGRIFPPYPFLKFLRDDDGSSHLSDSINWIENSRFGGKARFQRLSASSHSSNFDESDTDLHICRGDSLLCDQ